MSDARRWAGPRHFHAGLPARPSILGKGNCYDNAMVETFFKALKTGLV